MTIPTKRDGKTKPPASAPPETRVAVIETRPPDYLTEYAGSGTEQMADYQATPRLKIVQQTSAPELQDAFGVGSAIISPDMTLVAPYGSGFEAVTLLFWPSWARWRDIHDEEANVIDQETLDPSSELARRCRDRGSRKQAYDDGSDRQWTHTEHLNFVLELQGAIVCACTFRSKAHAVGRRLCGYLRRRAPAPIWSNRVRFAVDRRARGKESWYQLDFGTAPQPYIAKADVDRVRKLHEGLSAMFDAGRFGVVEPADGQGQADAGQE